VRNSSPGWQRKIFCSPLMFKLMSMVFFLRNDVWLRDYPEDKRQVNAVNEQQPLVYDVL
jgi:hypothetical protein